MTLATLEQALGSAPLWIIGTVFFFAQFAFSWGGTALRRLIERGGEHDTTSDGYLLSAALALLGLLVAFTFSLALTRYDTRRTMVVAEGNAISTAWLRAALVEGAEGDALKDSLRRYADVRAGLPAARDPAQAEARTVHLQAEVWTRLSAALHRLDPPIGATLVNATTEMFDAAASRKAEREARIPGRVLDVVCLYALMSAGIVGYVLGRRRDLRHAVVSMFLFMLLSLAIVLILDLDRPWSGSVTIPQQPIVDARAGMI